jgi:hypothetical protein
MVYKKLGVTPDAKTKVSPAIKYLGMILPPIIIATSFVILLLSHFSCSTVSAYSKHEPFSMYENTSGNTISQTQIVLVDDFDPQPLMGNSVFYYNRFGGDRGALEYSDLEWGQGRVTTTVTAGHSWGGLRMSLNHPDHEKETINFSSVLPSQILPAYQSQISGVTVQISKGTPGRRLTIELKGSEDFWSREAILWGGSQTLNYALPPLNEVNNLILKLDPANPGDYFVINRVELTATTSITDTALAAFVWSYGMLLNNWSPETGLVRDKSRDASGEFDAIQATGALAAATTLAEQLEIVDRTNAVQTVNAISNTLLGRTPRYHGLWPHFVEVLPSDELVIKPGTEWSSVDTAIAAVALLDAQSAFSLDSSGTEQMITEIDWEDLLTADGLAHGYTYTGELLTATWDTFGGESWLVGLAYASATHNVPPLKYPSPPTANGSGFIDELAWLFTLPPSREDFWGTDWATYLEGATDAQISYYPTNYPSSCFSQIGFFGLSAAEVPLPSIVITKEIYQAFGVGGQHALPNDGSALLGDPVVTPHYSAIIAHRRPQEALQLWNWLINQGPFSPLNNIESILFESSTGCDPTEMKWNHLKGSWNLSLQALGWGHYLAEQRGLVPVLWRATFLNNFLRGGYDVLVPGGISDTYLPLAVVSFQSR